MKYIIFILLLVLNNAAYADYADLERLQKIVSFKSCDVRIQNSEIKTYNCTAKEKSSNVKKEFERQKRNGKYKAQREIENKINKSINKQLDKLF
jgi:hypothetical protein